jgi:hypothetical protein
MRTRTSRLGACLLLAGTVLAAVASAHEIPSDVTVRMIVKPSPGRIEVLVRVPLEAMQDVEFPTSGPGYLDVARADRALRNAAMLWLANDINLYENGEALPRLELSAVRASIPSDRSFTSHAAALEHIRGPPLRTGTPLVWQQALLDVSFATPIHDPGARFSIRPDLDRLGLSVVTAIRFEGPNDTVRLLQLEQHDEVVALDPSWLEASLRFVRQGFEHILDGADHLLFLLCLVLPLRRRLGSLVLVVTAFTVAHSITLIASAYGLAPDTLWFPPPVEVLIAASIFYMAVETILASDAAARWPVAFVFGLVHGFGFSFALRNTLQFAGDHVASALLSFNLGVELGQLLVVVVLVAAARVAVERLPRPRLAIAAISVIVAHTAWHWMLDRVEVFRAYPVGWRELGAAAAGSGLHWLAIGLVVAALAWAGMRRRQARARGRW